MPLTMVEAGMKVVEGVAEGDTKKVAGGVGMAAGGLAGGYAGASIGATIGTFILPGIGTLIGGALGGAIGSFYGSQEGEALGEKLATPAPDRLAPPSEVSAGLSSVQTQNQQSQNVTYAPAFNFSGGDLVSAEKVTAMVAQVMQSHFTSDFTPLISTNPLATRATQPSAMESPDETTNGTRQFHLRPVPRVCLQHAGAQIRRWLD